jgi:hypothetical protein
MSALSVSGLWSAGNAELRGAAASVIPVAAAFMFLPQVLHAAFVGPQTVPTEPTLAEAGGQLLAALVSLFGQLAVISIYLRRAPDVRGALADAAATMPRALKLILLFGAVIAAVALTLGIVAAAAFGVRALEGGQLPPALALLGLPLLLAILWVAARLFPLFPALVAEGEGARASVRRVWAITKPAHMTLFLFGLSFLVAVIFAAMIANIVAGAVFGLLLGKALAHLLTATVVAAVATFFSLLSTGASTAAYRALR